MNIWRVLGIESTNDLSEIKRAYAKRSREVHPEDDPEGFEELHNAYEQAIQIAKNKTPRYYSDFRKSGNDESEYSKNQSEEIDSVDSQLDFDIVKNVPKQTKKSDNEIVFDSVKNAPLPPQQTDLEEKESDDFDIYDFDVIKNYKVPREYKRNPEVKEDDYTKNIDFNIVNNTENDEKYNTPNANQDGNKDAEDIDFNDIINTQEEEGYRKIVYKTAIVINSLENLYKNILTRKSKKKWSSYIYSNEFRELISYDYFVKQITKFLYMHPKLSNSVFECFINVFHLEELSTRENKGIYANLVGLYIAYINKPIKRIKIFSKYNLYTLFTFIAAVICFIISPGSGREIRGYATGIALILYGFYRIYVLIKLVKE